MTKVAQPLKLSMMQEGSLPFGPPQIHFPEDEGAHPAFPMEWWYGHFSLTDSEGGEYGAMVAYFSLGLRIISISDLETKRFYQTVSGSPLHHVEGFQDLRWCRDHWFRIDPNSFSYQLESYGAGIRLNLALVSDKPPLLGCGDGLSVWTGGDSYYYSFTRLRAEGQIEFAGRKMDVEGLGWMDHQWMGSLGEGGWDWFAAQLDNGIEVVFWNIVGTDESVKSSDLTIMFADNSVYSTQNFVLERMDSWVSPESGREYGILWRVREEAHDLDLLIKARYSKQEIRMFEAMSVPEFPFWEGRTAVSGRLRGESVSGIGYAELVRYPNIIG